MGDAQLRSVPQGRQSDGGDAKTGGRKSKEIEELVSETVKGKPELVGGSLGVRAPRRCPRKAPSLLILLLILFLLPLACRPGPGGSRGLTHTHTEKTTGQSGRRDTATFPSPPVQPQAQRCPLSSPAAAAAQLGLAADAELPGEGQGEAGRHAELRAAHRHVHQEECPFQGGHSPLPRAWLWSPCLQPLTPNFVLQSKAAASATREWTEQETLLLLEVPEGTLGTFHRGCGDRGHEHSPA